VRPVSRRAAHRCAKPARPPFDLRKKGFNRLFQDGRLFEFSTPESLRISIFRSRSGCWWTESPSVRSAPAPGRPTEICYGRPVKWFSKVRRRRIARPASFASTRSSSARPAAGFRRAQPSVQLQRAVGRLPALPGLGNTIDFDMTASFPKDAVSPPRKGAVRAMDQAQIPMLAGQFFVNSRRQSGHGHGLLRPPRSGREKIYEFIRRFFDTWKRKIQAAVRVFLAYRG